MKLKALASALWMGAKRHSPEILVGLGIAGAASSVIFAIKATPRAMILLDEKRQELGVEKLEAKEIIKTAAPVYIPTAVSFGVSVACIIGASSVNARRNAALTAAYTLSESTLRTYRDKVLETVGEDKEREIRQAAAIEQQQKTPETQTVVVNHAAGQLKCFDSLSGRYFTATGQWFWSMIVSLGLASMDDNRFHQSRAEFVIERFRRRDYQPNGAGGLFTLQNPKEDLRTLDIWYQMMAYLNENDI